MVCAQVLLLRSSAVAVIQLVGPCSAIPYAVAVDDLFLLDLWLRDGPMRRGRGRAVDM